MSITSIFSLSRLSLWALMGGVCVSAGHADVAEGAALFNQYCGQCHAQPDKQAQVQQGLYPLLVEVARTRTAEEMAAVVLRGKFDRSGEFLGQTIPVMPSHGQLANESVAAIVNHVRADAGVAGRVSTETVAELRGQLVQPEQAALSAAEYQRADDIYQTHCAGCHAVDRTGRSGSALRTWAMQANTEAVKATIHFGTAWGMPNWGMRETLSAEDIHLLARYLAAPSRGLPVFAERQVRASWRGEGEIRPAESVAGTAAAIKNLFVSLLHDTGQVMLIDGDSKNIVAVVDALPAPHMALRSADGRFVYVMSRAAEVVAIDLQVAPARVVSQVKAGFEGRSFALSRDGSTLAVGAYWPPQVTFLQAETLEPIAVQMVDSEAYAHNQTNEEISQVIALPGARRFLAVSKAGGNLYVLQPSRPMTAQHGIPYLRAGSFETTGRYLLIPADSARLVVFDTQKQRVARVMDIEGVLGGAQGAALVDADGRAVWMTAGLVSGQVVRIYTDGLPTQWHRVITEDPGGGGTMTLENHPASSHIWLDYPLNAATARSHAVGWLDRLDAAEPLRWLNIAELVGMADEPVVRLIHPQFNSAGDEIWLTLWNRQDRNSAIVVLDDRSQKVQTVLRDPRLVTPIRTFHLPYGVMP